MAYLGGKNNSISVLHVVRDLSGAAVTGEAANVTTALFDQAGASSAITVTVTEIGTTGFYTVSCTPTATGDWLLRVTNPAPLTADGSTSDYVLDIRAAADVSAAATKNLTTRARVKERLNIGASVTAFDDLIDSLVSEVSNYMQEKLGRVLVEQTYTEYYDGTGTPYLHLRQGPLVSVTSVNSVTYGGTTSRTETLTAVDEGDRLELGLRGEGWTMRGGIQLVGGTFVTGRRNYKVVYIAGYSTVPEGVVHAATDWVVASFLGRETFGLASKVIGESSIDPLSPAQVEAGIESAIAPYRYLGELC